MTLLFSILSPVKTIKKLGVYMDASSANLIEFTLELLKMKTLPSNLILFDGRQLLKHTEIHLECKDQYYNEYFQKLSDSILKYDEVLLFGKKATTTKLFDNLSLDNRFYKIKIEIKQTNKMTPNQQNDFVTDYFLLDKL